MLSDKAIDKKYVTSRLMALIDNLSDKSLLALLKQAESLPLKGNRKELRKVCRIRLNVLTPDTRARGTAHDISYSGIFVETANAPHPGKTISLIFSGSGQSASVEIKGEVMRINPRGIGVQFKDLTEEQERMIKSLVDSI